MTLGPATSGAITAETIILDDVVGAIMRVMTTCTAGSVGIGSGQWAIFVSSDGHVGKRHWKSPNTQAVRSNELLENGVKTRTTVDDRIAQIGVLATWAGKSNAEILHLVDLPDNGQSGKWVLLLSAGSTIPNQSSNGVTQKSRMWTP